MDGYVTIGTDLDLTGVERKMDQMIKILERKADTAGTNAGQKMSNKMAKSMAVGIGVVSNVVGKIMNAVENSIGGAISRVDTINNFPRVMASLGVNSQDAAESVDYLSEKLVGLPTTLDQGVSAVQRFTSANENVKASTEMFLALNNAILAGGAPVQQQAAALEQLSQAYAKGKPDMMEWRTALATMPAQLKQVAVAMGYVDATQLGEALRKGKVSMNDFMLTLVKMNKQSVNGFASLEEQAREGTGGIATSIANFKTAIVKAVSEILQTIGQANIASFFQTIINAIKAAIPYIAAFVKSFMAAITTVISVIGKISNAISGLFGKKAKKQADKTSSSIGNVSYAVGGIGDSADKSTKAAKKLNKELGNLQGFDEMNVLQDTTDAGSGGGNTTGGADTGGIGNLGNIGDLGIGDLGKKMKDLAFDTDLFTAAVWGLIGAFAAFKIIKLINDIGKFGLTIGEIAKYAFGIGLIIGGIVLIIKGVIDYLKDPTWENFMKILAGIALVAAGVALIFGAIPALIVAAILLVGAIALAIYKHWDEVKATLSKVGKWIDDNVIKPVVDFFKGLWESIKAIFTPVINFFGGIIGTVIDNIKITIDNTKQILKALWEAIKSIFEPIFKWFYDKVIKPIADKFKGLWDGIKSGVKAAADIVKNIFNGVVNFFKNIINTIVGVFKTIGKKVGDAIGKAFKGAINVVLGVIESTLNKPINAINSLIGVINDLPGMKLTKLKTFKLPRLAQGGIVNNPGPGVMMGSYVAGERGPEAVLPLTDDTLQRLANMMPITVNVTNSMNGRVISREIQKVQNQSNFAMNR